MKTNLPKNNPEQVVITEGISGNWKVEPEPVRTAPGPDGTTIAFMSARIKARQKLPVRVAPKLE